jgi:hypothetical protein
MNDPRSLLRPIAPLAAVLMVALAMAGCSKKVTNVDASYTAPEGKPSEDARLIVYSDAPVTLQAWKDDTPDGPGKDGFPGPEDSLRGTQQVSVAPGTLYGAILDGTPASGYQVLRREGSGGYAQLKDFVLSPMARFLDSQWELYAFSDARPASFSPPSYLGRGVVSGAVTSTSPLTNAGELARPSLAELVYKGSKTPSDSNFTLSWEAVPDAESYWIQIYQFTGRDSVEILRSAQPAPFVLQNARTYFIGRVDKPATEYTLGGPGAQVLMRRTLLFSVEYLVRIVAVDKRGEMIAFSYGDLGFIRRTGRYSSFPSGAIKVTPTHPKPKL